MSENDTLQEYFERGEQFGIIDYALRIVRSPEGKLDFYIHPQNKNGETCDFTVSGAFVTRLGFGAGSSRAMSAPLRASALTSSEEPALAGDTGSPQTALEA